MILVPDEAERPFPVRFEGNRDIVEQAELFCLRLLRTEGSYETVIQTSDGVTIVEEGRIGDYIGVPLYKHRCVECGKHDWCDIAPGPDDAYLCYVCTIALRSRLHVTDAMLH